MPFGKFHFEIGNVSQITKMSIVTKYVECFFFCQKKKHPGEFFFACIFFFLKEMHVLCFFWQDPETYQWYVQASADYFQVTFEEAESMVGRAPPNPMQRALNIDSRGFLPKRLGEFLMEKNWGNFFWGLEVVGCFFCYYFDLSVQICSFAPILGPGI